MKLDSSIESARLPNKREFAYFTAVINIVVNYGWISNVAYAARNHKAMINLISSFRRVNNGRTPRSDEELLRFVDSYDDAFLIG